ncbi:hypothetical protein RHMOL_Rhmol13G0097400 [Rhododendron molle]|uniref:Uncharacterized protein n=1 Tax=Rhododendron molle TaxID=49168 RepID=A0ACC0L6G6_RHOML|nr:hypothetical protein RHMOL_Rhmol13G0097400 [Rhododendron molle]
MSFDYSSGDSDSDEIDVELQKMGIEEDKVTIFRERVVLVAVYVETPKRRRFSSNNHRRRHHYRASNGTNRRADLLDYSRRLRESGRSRSSNPLLLHPKPESSPSNNQHPLKQIIPLQGNSKQERTPTCLGNCKTEIPSFLRSLVSQCKPGLKAKKKKGASETTAAQMKIIMQSFQLAIRLSVCELLPPWDIATIVWDIRQFREELGVTFAWVRRKANQLAHVAGNKSDERLVTGLVASWVASPTYWFYFLCSSKGFSSL